VIDVLIVDDNPIVRAALRGYLDSTEEVRVVAEAGNGQEALAAVRRFRPTVTLLDHRMPIADGLSVVSALAQYTSVLALTSDASDDLIMSMLRNGARGYLVHGQFDPPDLLRAVLAVAGGHGWLSPVAASVAASALRDQVERDREQRVLAERQQAAQGRFGLTIRERDVLALLCQGLSNAAIAHRLTLTEKTVKNHLNHIFAKLQVTSRTEAVVRWTNEHGHGR
jgi:DNA-binding NarL/FixJ family response regulator